MTNTRQVRLRAARHPVDCTIRLPGSKSLTNRALLIAALARGDSTIENVLLADDTRCMLQALEELGVRLRVDTTTKRAEVSGCGGHWPAGEASLFCGNAGTVIRFLAAACAASNGEYRLDGIARMRERPIGALVDALRDLGALIGYEHHEGFCPINIHARGLRGGEVSFREPPSSQFVSALLIAAPLAMRDVMIDVSGPLPSEPYINMTLVVMEAFGVGALQEQQRFIVPAPQTYQATTYRVEPDASAASYFFAAAAVTGGRVTIEGLGTKSCQGDIHFANVLRDMGCRVAQDDHRTTVWGPASGQLRGVDVDLNAMPDVAPTLAVLAAFAEGPTRIRNVGNLRIKESDRLAALTVELGRIGVGVRGNGNEIIIEPRQPLIPCGVQTYEDHRIAMSFAVAGLRLNELIIEGADCVNKTFPDFFEQWEVMQK